MTNLKKNCGENILIFTFSHLADAFIQSNLQMRTMEAIKINKREIKCKCFLFFWLSKLLGEKKTFWDKKKKM